MTTDTWEGNEITEEDKRLYDILIRFDAVYYFKQRLNRKALRDYDNLWSYEKNYTAFGDIKNLQISKRSNKKNFSGPKKKIHIRS